MSDNAARISLAYLQEDVKTLTREVEQLKEQYAVDHSNLEMLMDQWRDSHD